MSFFNKDKAAQPPQTPATPGQPAPAQPPQATPGLKPAPPMSVEAQLTELSTKRGRTVEQLRSEMDDIKKKYSVTSDSAALSILKSQLQSGAGTRQTKEFYARCISREGPRQAQSQRAGGGEYTRSDVDLIILNDDGQPALVSLGLFEGDAKDVDKFYWGNVYKLTVDWYKTRDGRIRFGVPQGQSLSVVEVPDADPNAQKVPTFQAAVKADVQTLNQLEKFVDRTYVFSGRIGRHAQSRDGTYMGFEASDDTVFEPIMCWVHDPLRAEMSSQPIPLGTDVWIYGYIRKDDQNRISVSVRGVYPPG